MSLRNHARRLHHHFARHDHSKLEARDALPQPVPQLQRIQGGDDGEEVVQMADQGSIIFVTAPKTFDGPAVMVTEASSPEPDRGRNDDPPPRPRPVIQPDDDDDQDSNNNNNNNNSRNGDEGRNNNNDNNNNRNGNGDGQDERDDRPSRPQPQPSGEGSRSEATEPQETDNLLPIGIPDESSSSPPPPSRNTDVSNGFDGNDDTAADRTGALASLTGSLAATATATAIAGGEEDDGSGGGVSPGATAGIVIGVLLVVGALLAGAFFYSRKQRKDRQGLARLNDEKSSDAAANNHAGSEAAAPQPPPMTSKASVRTARTASTAPRLSLRPLTAFVPNLASDRRSNGNQLEMQSPFSPSASKEVPINDLPPSPLSSGSPPRDPATPGHVANDPANPFGNHAEPVDKSPTSDRGLEAPPPAPSAAAPMPVPIMAPVSAPTPSPTAAAASSSRPALGGPLKTDSVSLISGVLPPGANGSQTNLVPPNGPAPVAGAGPDKGMAAAMAARSTPAAPDRPFAGPPKPLSVHSAVSVPLALGSPARADFGDSASIVSDGSGASPNRSPVPNNVYRVQMDYAPAMEDELEIRAGQLIRLLHEYDDGWGLCIRMDRSQQGVVPRTCLSRYPVKPRPAGQQPSIPYGRPNGPQWGSQNGSPQARGPNGQMPASATPPPGPAFSVVGHGPSQPFNGPPPVAFPAPPRPHSPASANMPGPVPMPMPMPMPMQGRQMSPVSQGRNSPGPAAHQQQRQQQQQRKASPPHFRGPPPPRSLSPGPYVAYQRPSVPQSRRRSNSAGDITPFRAGSPPGQKPSPLNPNSAEGQPEPLSLPQRKPVPGVAM